MRVHELARLLDLENRQVLDELGILGIDVTTASNSIKPHLLERVVAHFSDRNELYKSRLLGVLESRVECGRQGTAPSARSVAVNPYNFRRYLENAKDGQLVLLEPGDYKGPFEINHGVTLKGTGADTVLFASSEPAIYVTVPQVHLENLRLERTNGGEEGKIVLDCAPDTSPNLVGVQLVGSAPGARIPDASWEIPLAVDLGQVYSGQVHTREIVISAESQCHVTTNLPTVRVVPSYVAPGQTVLRVTVDGTTAVAGSRMCAEILLKPAGSPLRRIPVTAEYITKKVAVPAGEVGAVIREEIDFVTWGITFPRGAAQRLMKKLGLADNQLDDYREKAVRYLRELNDDGSSLFYLRKRGQGEKRDQQKWELTIATDNAEYPLPKQLAERGTTVKLSGVVDDEGYDSGFLVLDASLIDVRRGCRDAFALPLCIKFEQYYASRITLPDDVVDRIDELPDCKDYLPTTDQLTIWESYVAIERRLAEARQFCVPYDYVRQNLDRNSIILSFKVDPDNASLSSPEADPISLEEFWSRALKAKNDFIKLVDDDPFEESRDVAQLLGRIEQVDRSGCFLRVRLEDDVAEAIDKDRLQVPRRGWLLFDAFGNLIEVKRKEFALKDLRAGKVSNPFLGSFFFDASQARSPESIPALDHWLAPDRVNEEQRLAVEKVMAAQDLALIWGPPGTGKTTVIAEICYQVALRGGKTLIASQTNLAVDNAMSRLVHDPNIRALRKGKESKVEDEGKQYTEQHVIGTWLGKTAAHCKKSLAQRREKVEIFRRLLADQTRLERYIRLEEQHQGAQKELQNELARLKGERASLLTANEADQAALTSVQDLTAGLRSMEVQGEFRTAEAICIQVAVIPLISDQPVFHKWQKRVNEAAGILAENGIEPPALPILATVEDLKERSRKGIEENAELLSLIQIALGHVETVNAQLSRLVGHEKARQSAEKKLIAARESEGKSVGCHAELSAELERAQEIDLLLSFAPRGTDHAEWFGSQSLELQQELSSYMAGSELFAGFQERLSAMISLMERLGLAVPELPPLSRAADCRRIMAPLLTGSGDLAREVQQRLHLTDEAHHAIEELEALQRARVESEKGLQRTQKDLEDLNPKGAALREHLSLFRESHQEFPGWIQSLKGHLDLVLSLGITAESRFTLENLPQLPPALGEVVDQLGSEKVTWLRLCDQFVGFLNQASDKEQQRAAANALAQEIRLKLEHGLQVIGPKYAASPGSFGSSLSFDLPAIQRRADALLSSIRMPLGLWDQITNAFGKSGRRRAEFNEIVALGTRVEGCLAMLPSPPTLNELKQVASSFLATLLSQGEAWLKRGCQAQEAKVADQLAAMDGAERQKRECEEALTRINRELRDAEGRIDSLVADLTARHHGMRTLGLIIEPFAAGDRERIPALYSYLTATAGKIKRWGEDVSAVQELLPQIDPAGLLAAMSSFEKARVSKLCDQMNAATTDLNSCRAARVVAEAALRQAEGVLNQERNAWDSNPLRSLLKVPPFSTLTICSRLRKVLSATLSGLSSVAAMEAELKALWLTIEREDKEIRPALEILDSLKTRSILIPAGEILAARREDLEKNLATRNNQLDSRLNPGIAALESKLESQDKRLASDRAWWATSWESMPERLHGHMATGNIHAPGFLRVIAGSLPAWRSELNIEENYLKRYEALVGDWIDRLRSPSPQDAADLRTLYLANTNVIGITCSQAAAPRFSGEFPEFDVVIVDEVSKCTPPELMMPALKGRKLVLVGDHRQLPPMIENHTIEDVAMDAGIPVEELSFLKNSSFNTLYTGAAEQIKQGLRWQYRMHPSIMGAINQFYDHCLKNGVADPATSRAHGLGGELLKNEHHLVWVSTPLNSEYAEGAEGTSFYNLKEIDAIDGICRQMNEAWAPRVDAGEPRKEVAIITFYLPQLRRIRERINGAGYANLSIRTGTVDRFQGMERPVVIVSLVRNNAKGSVGFARSPERVNVAFSRAQELLMIVGCRELFVQNAPVSARRIYQEVSDEVRRHGGLLDVSGFC